MDVAVGVGADDVLGYFDTVGVEAADELAVGEDGPVIEEEGGCTVMIFNDCFQGRSP